VKDPLDRKGLRPSLPDSAASANHQVTHKHRVKLVQGTIILYIKIF
jgi:hypothetical protein